MTVELDKLAEMIESGKGETLAAQEVAFRALRLFGSDHDQSVPRLIEMSMNRARYLTLIEVWELFAGKRYPDKDLPGWLQ